MAKKKISIPTGIEKVPGAGRTERAGNGDEIVSVLSLNRQHLRLTQVVLADQTDYHNELVQERQWLLHPSDIEISLRGNLFVIEDLEKGSGIILVKRTPLPWARPVQSGCDLRITPRKGFGFDFTLLDSYPPSPAAWETLKYKGGMIQRTAALHSWQAAQRPATPGHTLPRFLSNTWGDRSQDSRIMEDFIASEIDAAYHLGVDVVQIDDGWQRGVTSNSALAAERGGVWEGFWNTDQKFWDTHPERFPCGLKPVVDRAQGRGINIGLWFAPDSWNDFANWRKDADRILELFTILDVEHFKVDGVNAMSDLAFANLQRFFKAALDGSNGKVVFDLDITAGFRPGYFGAMEAGTLFVENRYTDWHNYWPHQTLRNLWKLSRWIDPRRLRMEFLNNTRNIEKYPEDPLMPARYSPAVLFATVMFSNPLGWFEISGLPEVYISSVSSLVRTWKEHRVEIFAGAILPVGGEPDGFAPTGFLSLPEAGKSGYLLIFRELHHADRFTVEVPGTRFEDCEWELLAGDGSIESDGAGVVVNIPESLGFIFTRFSRSGGRKKVRV